MLPFKSHAFNSLLLTILPDFVMQFNIWLFSKTFSCYLAWTESFANKGMFTRNEI